MIPSCPVFAFPLYFPFRYPELAAVCRDRRTLILYPGPKSENLEELVQQNEIGAEKHNVIIIDGTWSQAKNMFLKNSLFHLPKQVYSSSHICNMVSLCWPVKWRHRWWPVPRFQVQLNGTLSSQYVIRTQPSNICLSTLESAAYALSILEKNDSIQEVQYGNICWFMCRFVCWSWPFSPGPTKAPEGPLLLPAGTRCSDSSQQGASPEKRHVWQTDADKQEQDKKDGETSHRPQDLS